jgi:hypothetical protein
MTRNVSQHGQRVRAAPAGVGLDPAYAFLVLQDAPENDALAGHRSRNSTSSPHRVELRKAEKQPVGVAGEFSEAVVERFGVVVQRVENHGHERKCLTGFPAVTKGLGQQARPSPGP